MAEYEPHLVAPFVTGMDLGLDSWLTPLDAYQDVQNGYQFRGVVYKRGGYTYFGSIPHCITATYQNIVDITTVVPAQVTVNGHGLLTGSIVQFVNVTGITAGSDGVTINSTRWVITVTGVNTFTINNAVPFGGAFVPGSGTASNFPGLPITLITNYVGAPPNATAGSLQGIICDTRRAAYYDPNFMCYVPIGAADQFTGTESNLFWAENYFGYLFITNNKDNIFYWDNAPAQITGGLSSLVPYLGPAFTGSTVDTCLMIKAVNNRLCLFNVTISGNVQATTVVFCAFNFDPNDAVINAWDQVTPGNNGVGNGGSVTATDSLYLMTMGQVQTNLVVWSRGQNEGITYQFQINNDPSRPYRFIKIASTRNVDSTFGTVVLDRQITGVGSTGLVTSDGNSVGRYDQKIPLYSYANIAVSSVDRCYGARYDSLYQQWLLYPDAGNRIVDGSGNLRNSGILVFNYEDTSWSHYDISMSVLGQFNQTGLDPSWNSYGSALPDYSWEDFTEETWNSPQLQANNPILLGGDYAGNVWIMNQGSNDGINAQAFGQPFNDGTAIDFQLLTRQWAPYVDQGKACQFGFLDLLIASSPVTTYNIAFYVDNDPDAYRTQVITAIPNEQLFITSITGASKSNPCVLTSVDSQIASGLNVWIYGVQGMTELNGVPFVTTAIDDDHFSVNIDSTSFATYTGGGQVFNSPIVESIFWRRVWSGQQGTFHTIQIICDQMNELVELHGLNFWSKPTGRIYR